LSSGSLAQECSAARLRLDLFDPFKAFMGESSHDTCGVATFWGLRESSAHSGNCQCDAPDVAWGAVSVPDFSVSPWAAGDVPVDWLPGEVVAAGSLDAGWPDAGGFEAGGFEAGVAAAAPFEVAAGVPVPGLAAGADAGDDEDEVDGEDDEDGVDCSPVFGVALALLAGQEVPAVDGAGAVDDAGAGDVAGAGEAVAGDDADGAAGLPAGSAVPPPVAVGLAAAPAGAVDAAGSSTFGAGAAGAGTGGFMDEGCALGAWGFSSSTGTV
jgi:hypothetical protein